MTGTHRLTKGRRRHRRRAAVTEVHGLVSISVGMAAFIAGLSWVCKDTEEERLD